MIGFTVPVRIWDENGELTHAKAMLAFDNEGDTPTLDLRLADEKIIVNVDIQDAYDAIYEIKRQFNEWEREQPVERVEA